MSIAALGDVDGDGLADFAVSAPSASDGGPAGAGVVYLVLGSKTRTSIDLADDTDKGIVRLRGVAAGDNTGWSLAALDTPGTGGERGLVVGAPLADPFGRPDAGSVYVLPAPLPTRATVAPGLLSSRGDVALDKLAATSYRIDGAVAGGQAGYAVGTSADMTLDRLPEVLVGAPRVAPDAAGTAAGAAYVAPAGPLGGSVDLAAPAATGMTVSGEAGSELGRSIAGIGDVDGDGVPDVAIGAPTASPGGRAEAGSAFVVRGSSVATQIDAAAPAADSLIRIDGANANNRFGTKVAGADVDGDASADLVVTAPQTQALGRMNAGAVYALLGSRLRTANTALLESAGVRLAGPVAGDLVGTALAVGPDPPGDARSDVLVRGTSGTSLLELPQVAKEPATVSTPGCDLARDVQVVVDDSGSMRLRDPDGLRAAAINQMVTKLRLVEFDVGAIEIGTRAQQILPTLAVPVGGITGADDLATISGLKDERIRNDAGPAALDSGLAAVVAARPAVAAIILVTDAADAAPPVALADPGRRVYVVAVKSAFTKTPSAGALKQLAAASGGRYFADVDASSLPGALSIVEAELNCEQALKTEIVATGDASVPAPTPSAVATTTDPDQAVAEAKVAPAQDTTIDTPVPPQLDTVTFTLKFHQPPRSKRRKRASCVGGSAVRLARVEIFAAGSRRPAVRATGRKLRAALRGQSTPVGKGVRLLGGCGRGSILVRIRGLQGISPVASQAQAAANGSASRTARFAVSKGGKGKRASHFTATTRAGHPRKKPGR